MNLISIWLILLTIGVCFDFWCLWQLLNWLLEQNVII